MPPALFYDLHVCESQLEPQTQRERVALALKLGFDGLALVHQAKTERLGEQDRCALKPTELAALLSATQGVDKAMQACRASHAQHGNAYAVRQLTRLNFPASDVSTAQAAVANTAVTRGYDLLAVQPLSERAFALACTSLDVDIVALDLTRRLPFRFKPALVRAALARGLVFEICFSPALREAGARRQLFTNAQALCRETRGRGIIVSSCARTAMELRGPHDVMNMATLFGLSQQQAQHAISRNVEAALQHAAARKAYKGVLTIQRVEDGGEAGGAAVVSQQHGTQPSTGMQGDKEGGQATGQSAAEQQGAQQAMQLQPSGQKPQGHPQQQQRQQGQKRKFGQAVAPTLLPGQKRLP